MKLHFVVSILTGPYSPNNRPANPIAQEFSSNVRLAPAEATVAIAGVVFVVAPLATRTEVLVIVVGKQIPALVGLHPPAQQPLMALRVTAALPEIVVAGQVQ